MPSQPIARTLFVIATGAILLASPGNAALAATPVNSAKFAVSATVLPACNDTACRSIPRVVTYEPAKGSNGLPAFGLVADSRPIMTITY